MLFSLTESDLLCPGCSQAISCLYGRLLPYSKEARCLPEHIGFIKASLKTYLLVQEDAVSIGCCFLVHTLLSGVAALRTFREHFWEPAVGKESYRGREVTSDLGFALRDPAK